MFIYVLVCKESLKLYVGQHKGESLQRYLQQKDWQAHHYSGKRSHLYAAMRKHPRETWSIWPLVSNVQTRAELDELEKHFIRVLKTQHPDVGYNICDGGEGFTGPHTKAECRRISKRMKAQWAAGWQGVRGKKHSEEWKRQASVRKKQYKPTAETKQKISATLTGHGVSDAMRDRMREIGKQLVGEKNPFFGKHHSEESNRRNAEAHRKPWSAARRAAYEASKSL